MKNKWLVSIFICIFITFGCLILTMADPEPDANSLERFYWGTDLIQVIRFGNTYIYGGNNSDVCGENVYGLHFTPAWRWDRFEGSFDFAMYRNPWNEEQWQWGVPLPGENPRIPNFIDKLAYHGKYIELNYEKITDLSFGHGLLMDAYHPIKTYHGWTVMITPTDATKLTIIANQEIVYFEPFVSDGFASLRIYHLDQSFDTLGLKWQFGATDIEENYHNLDSTKYPNCGSEFDLTLTNWVWLMPFYEVGGFAKSSSGAAMIGIKGKMGLFDYQLGGFRAQSGFIPDYFGGRYEDLKWNTFANPMNPGKLRDLHEISQDRNGYIGRLGVELNSWLNLEYIYLDDNIDTQGLNISGQIERLRTEYGLFYYQINQGLSNYDWYLKSGNGILGYEYHFYADWDHKCHNDFSVVYHF